MNAVSKVNVELSVVLGNSHMPIRQLLKMGRGAVIDLDTKHDDLCRIYANGELIAQGEVLMVGDRVGITITSLVNQQGE